MKAIGCLYVNFISCYFTPSNNKKIKDLLLKYSHRSYRAYLSFMVVVPFCTKLPLCLLGA